jgi:uncharacterized membrane protein
MPPERSDHPERVRHTERGLDRLVNFTDAVAAIAITLLVLPLVDIPAKIANGSEAVTVFSSHLPTLESFAVSFIAIGMLWRQHHRIFERVTDYSERLIQLNMLWLFTIVVLPFPSALFGAIASTPPPIVYGFYFGTLTVSSALLALIAVMVERNPALRAVQDVEGESAVISVGRQLSQYSLVGFFTVAFLFLVATAVSVLVPGVGAWAALALFLQGPIRRGLRYLDGRGARRAE